MHISPALVYAIGAGIGAAMGIGSFRIAEILSARSDITHRAAGSTRTRVLLVVLPMVTGLALAHAMRSSGSALLPETAANFALDVFACAALFAAAAVDIEHMILPNEITLGIAAIGLVTSPFRSVGFRGALVGAICAAVLSIVPAAIYKKIRGRSGIGFGDAKLVVASGAWLGTTGAFFVLFAGAMQSTFVALAARALGRSFPVPESVKLQIAELRAQAEKGDAEALALLADDPMAYDETGLATTRLPMGPFLVLAFVEFLIFRESIERFLMPM
ncbi:MAG: A24 family peptidase [Polyangiaceae bacterium]|nr:A24 family peptidase [Polyangiaceae bacterium]